MAETHFLSEADFNWQSKTVALRFDGDVPVSYRHGNWQVSEDYRLRMVLPTIHFLQRKKVARIIFLAHRGRPGGKRVASLSLQPVAAWLASKLGSCRLVPWRKNFNLQPYQLRENLRFMPGETANSFRFARQLAIAADVFVNDAFAVSHRRQASITGLPRLLPSFLGLRFETEMRTLSWLYKEAKRPLIFVLGGSKPGKVDYLRFLAKWADKVLVGGRLPEMVPSALAANPRLLLASLAAGGRDIDSSSIAEFKKQLAAAATVFWAGPLGVYEKAASRRGTWAVAKKIAQTGAFKVAGGGDTQRILSQLRIWPAFDFVSVGGGAMLQFLRDQTLPGIKAIVDKRDLTG